METFARVRRLQGASAVVAVEADGGGCGRCSEPGGCRSGLLSQIFRSPVSEFSVPNDIDACTGDRVLVRLEAGGLARWSLTTYLLPVFAVLTGAAIGALAAGEAYSRDVSAVGGALVGLVLAAWLIVFRLAPASVDNRPRLVRIGEDVLRCRREEKP